MRIKLNGTSAYSDITYDNTGNPLSYMGATLTWQGSNLTQYTKSTNTYSFAYDCNGIRRAKTVNGVTTNYYYGDQGLLSETKGSDTIWYLYGETGLMGFELNGESYYYIRNLQADVLNIVNSSRTVVVNYVYDSWGKVVSTTGTLASTIGVLNPIRYRGYYYDTETSLYYLMSRYYDPDTGRFISPDGIISDSSLFTYCGNDPVNYTDSTGYFIDYLLDVVFIAWSINDVINDPSDWKNWAALGVDLVFAVIPFVPSGAGQAIKIGNKIDNALDVASAINKIDNIYDIGKVTMIDRDMNRVKDTAKLIGKADDLYDVWKGYDRVASVSKTLELIYLKEGNFDYENEKLFH